MRSRPELFELYKEEKAIVIGDMATRTTESFPSFGDWLKTYEHEFWQVHESVSIPEADKRAEAAQNEFDREVTGDEPVEPKPVEEKPTVSTDTKKPETVTSTTKPAADTATVTATAAPSKSEKAVAIFDSMYPKVQKGEAARKDVIARFTSEAGMTKAYASTKYQALKKKADAA